MNKKKKGLRLSELMLITVLVIFGVALIVGILLLRKDNINEWLDLAKTYFFGILTLGALLPASFTFAGKALDLRTTLFVAAEIVFYVSVIGAFGVALFAIARKKGRALTNVIGMLVGSFSAAYIGSMLFPLLINGVFMGRRNLCILGGLLLGAVVVYSTSLLCSLMALGGEMIKLAAPCEEKKEEVAPVKEEKAEPVKEEKPAEPVKVTVVVEHKHEEVKAEEPKEEPVEEVVEEVEKRVIERVPFEYKLLHAEKDLKKKYAELKEYFESYGLKGRISVDGDSFRLHRVLYAQITIAGKKMKVYYKLNPNDFADSPIPVKDSSYVKKYADIPAELDVKSDLSVKRAKELMDRVMQEAGIEKAQ